MRQEPIIEIIPSVGDDDDEKAISGLLEEE